MHGSPLEQCRHWLVSAFILLRVHLATSPLSPSPGSSTPASSCLNDRELKFLQSLTSSDQVQLGELVGVLGRGTSGGELQDVMQSLRCLPQDEALLMHQALAELGYSERFAPPAASPRTDLEDAQDPGLEQQQARAQHAKRDNFGVCWSSQMRCDPHPEERLVAIQIVNCAAPDGAGNSVWVFFNGVASSRKVHVSGLSHDARYVFHMHITSPAGEVVYQTIRTFGVQVWSGLGTVAQHKTEYLMQLAVPPLSWSSPAGAYMQVAVYDVPNIKLIRVNSDLSAIQELMIAMITKPVMLQDGAKAVPLPPRVNPPDHRNNDTWQHQLNRLKRGLISGTFFFF